MDQNAVVDATNSTVTPTTIEVVSNPSIDNVGGFSDANSADRVQPRQLVSGKSRGIQQLGGPNLYADSDNQQIVSVNNGIPQVMLGNNATFGEGFYATKLGKDVTTATDPNDFIFNSNQDIFKIVKEDTGLSASFTVTTPASQYAISSGTTTIPHNLGFIPAIQAYVNVNGLYYQIPYFAFSTGGTNYAQFYYAAATDDTNVYLTTQAFAFNQTTPLSSFPLPVKYFLFQETAN